MSQGTLKILYIVGKGRSGGTLLSNMLGQIEGFVSTGELRDLWMWALPESRLCGCGRPIQECPFWLDVLRTALDAKRDPAVATIASWERRIMSWPAIPRMLIQPHGRRPRWKILDWYVEIMGRTYGALAQAAGARVVVEASRWAPSPTALGLVPGVDSYVLHLVRDPRAVVYSWNKREKRWVDRPGSPNLRYGALYSVASWWARNFVAEMAASRRGRDRYVRYRYEDFIRNPRASLRAICNWVGEPEPDLSFISDGKAHLRPTHTVGGNPDRLRSGPIDIRPDDEWLTRQPLRDRILGTALSIPFLQLYGYPLVPRQPAPGRE
jgi:hypothetical protein